MVIQGRLTRGTSVSGIVFDLDGTLVDSKRTITRACNEALRRNGFEPRDVSAVTTFIGDGARMLMARAACLPPHDHRVEALTNDFIETYQANPLDGTELLPGALPTLQACSRYSLFLCTNKPRSTAELLLSGLNLTAFFRGINAGGDQPEKKPDPTPLYRLAEQAKLHPSQLIMVGDSAQDIACGRAAGAYSVAVLGGYGARTDLLSAGPDVVLEQISELPALFSAPEPARKATHAK